MRNIYFPEEEVSGNDLYFVCSMIERIARQLKQPNKYVANTMGKEALAEKLSLANVLHSENPLAVTADWIETYRLRPGTFDVTLVDPRLVDHIPTPLQMGKVYMRLILSTLTGNEDFAEGILRVYNNPICSIIDNYNSSAYYEPSYVQTRSYWQGSFN
ncbi:MAG: hypothetical protein PHC95_10145 [Parabacteroides sp.]|nr:hypothetical protein [Parabacteroides sp.]